MFNNNELNPRGTGLGLYSCCNICREIGPNEKI